jgi:hypothetical protein
MVMVLALAVVIAVIIFGGLISVGNERQRKAIDHLREQVVLWAMQDLQIKREKLAREVRIEDPLTWLNKVAAKIVGYNMNLRAVEFFDTPAALVCTTSEGKAVLSPLSPQAIRRMKKERKSRLTQFSHNNPLNSLPKGSGIFEISALNAGIMFDLELPRAWNSLTGQDMGQTRIWLYILV